LRQLIEADLASGGRQVLRIEVAVPDAQDRNDVPPLSIRFTLTEPVELAKNLILG
jgi:hypothetical protein